MSRKISILILYFLHCFFNFAFADGTSSPKDGAQWAWGNSGGAQSSYFSTPQLACQNYASTFATSVFIPPDCPGTITNTVSMCRVNPGTTEGNVVVHSEVIYGCSYRPPVAGDNQDVLYSKNGPVCPVRATLLKDGTCLCPPKTTLDPVAFVCQIVAETVPAQEPMPFCQKCQFGQPISPLTGSMTHSISLDVGLGKSSQVLTFDTSRRLPVYPVPAPHGQYSDLEPAGSPLFGELWSGSLQKQLLLDQYNARVLRGDGTGTNFTLDGSSNATPVSAGLPDRLIIAANGSQYSNLSENSEEFYSNSGILTGISFADGRVLTYSYSDSSTPVSIAPGPGYLLQISDNFSRTINFVYSGAQIAQIFDSAGASVGLKYDASLNLSQITWADGSFLQLVYGRPDLPWALTSLIDENGQTTVSWEYDAAGRASATQSGGGAARYSVDYGASAPALAVQDVWDDTFQVVRRTRGVQLAGAPVVTLPNGSQTTVSAAVVQNMPRLASISHPAGAGTPASVVHQSYDPITSNRLSAQDSNGNTTCYAYESTRNLVTVMLEGLPSTKTCPSALSDYVPSPSDSAHPERKKTTSWHPDWALKVREAAPKRITTWIYNGQSDPINAGATASCVSPAVTLPDGKPVAVLCARYEQATTDANGALGMSATVTGATRAWTYTYNQYGQVLTETTPKQSPTDASSHTTSYVYYPDTSFSGAVGHTMGDLNTITNPLGQKTTFTAYDKAGRLLSSTDANGVVTSMTYWPRGWLHTKTVTAATGAGLTTTYDYWPTGLLKTVTMPDASTLNYAYDDAHRLTDVRDAAGNKVHYVLDNSGNRTSEQVSDASGNLTSSISRVFDALNRVQSQTGAQH